MVPHVGEVLGHGGQILGKVVVGIAAQVCPPGQRGGFVGLAVAGVVDWGRVGEQQDVLHAIFACLLHEVLLPGGMAPVIGDTVAVQEALCPACHIFDVAVVALRGAAGTQVHTPVAQPDAFGAATAVERSGEEQFCGAFAHGGSEVAPHVVAEPAVAGTEFLNHLVLLVEVCHRAHRSRGWHGSQQAQCREEAYCRMHRCFLISSKKNEESKKREARCFRALRHLHLASRFLRLIQSISPYPG